MRPEIIEFAEIPVNAFAWCVEKFPYHWHDALEIVLVLEGSVNISLGDENLLLQENDIAIVNMGELHRITKSEKNNKVLIMHIDSEFYQKNLPDIRYLFLYCCSVYHEGKIPDKYKKLKEYIQELYKLINENSNKANTKNIESILTILLDYITYNFDFLRWGYGTVAFDEKHVQRLRQIAENIFNDQDSNPGLKELAAGVDLSLHHLSHDIKDKFGLTFQELLYYSSIEYAAKLLLSTDKRIVDIALECKFSDPKYLIKHFKHHFGNTPSKFRKLYRKDNKILASQVRYQDYLLS